MILIVNLSRLQLLIFCSYSVTQDKTALGNYIVTRTAIVMFAGKIDCNYPAYFVCRGQYFEKAIENYGISCPNPINPHWVSE
ncbi:MAG: hypothetical protein LBJ67_18465 [Planctomycetaceae bacterium]|jgi:hypothetical protein|nr:hypothetical protein [Planctomycetaceae bacterium]